MVVVLLYWIYLFWLFSTIGIGAQSLFPCNLKPIITIILGAFTITISASIYSFFGGLGIYFEGALLAVSIALFTKNRNHYKAFIFSLKAKILELSSYSKILLLVSTLLCILQSASAPYLIDNESYYLQTIQWLDGFGMVKGVANLHPFLMQFSGWHILQSAVNLDATGLPLNDLSGFILLIGLYYSIAMLQTFFASKNSIFLYAGYFILFSIFLFRFISVPSPDVAIYTLGLVIFFESYLWSKSYERNIDKLSMLFILAVFAIFIKLTALFLVLIPLATYFLTLRQRDENDVERLEMAERMLSRKRNKAFLRTISVSIFCGLIFILKNHIVSGYALFPLHISLGDPDWKVAKPILDWYTQQTLLDAFQTQSATFLNKSFFQRFLHWITLNGIDGILNKAITLVLLTFPMIVWKKNWDRLLITLYALSLLQFILIWNNAPQFRFFFVFFMLLVSVVLSLAFYKEWLVKLVIIVAVVVTAIPILVPMQLSTLSSTSFLASAQPFQWKHIITPHPNTRYTRLKHKSVTYGNMLLQSPVNSEFFWGTGDCQVPCVNIEQLDYFKKYFGIIPQLRSQNISDGFYAKQVEDE